MGCSASKIKYIKKARDYVHFVTQTLAQNLIMKIKRLKGEKREKKTST
jgi:hypothetical protein